MQFHKQLFFFCIFLAFNYNGNKKIKKLPAVHLKWIVVHFKKIAVFAHNEPRTI